MARSTWRVVISLGVSIVGVVFIFFLRGYVLHKGYTVMQPGELKPMAPIPAAWLGYCFLALGVLGLCGVNIFVGGPLDKRQDSDSKSDDEIPRSS